MSLLSVFTKSFIFFSEYVNIIQNTPTNFYILYKGVLSPSYVQFDINNKAAPLSVLSLTENTPNYDCSKGQVMSYDMLRIVMIGSAKLIHNGEQSEPHNSKLTTNRKRGNISAVKPICFLFLSLYALRCFVILLILLQHIQSTVFSGRHTRMSFKELSKITFAGKITLLYYFSVT